MTKNGKVEIGKTPSVVSGKPCQVIKEGEPVRKDEQDKEEVRGMRKLASVLDDAQ